MFTGTPLAVEDGKSFTELPLACNAAARIAVFMQHDPELTKLLATMKFNRNDKSISGFKEPSEMTNDEAQHEATYRPASSSAADSQSTASAFSYRYGNATVNSSNTNNYNGGGAYGGAYGREYYNGRGRQAQTAYTLPVYGSGGGGNVWNGMIFSFQLDEFGEHVSASTLQRCCSMIVTIACDQYPEVKAKLVHTRCHELILGSFKNFRGDADLIRYGCLALFTACRGNALQQSNVQDPHF